MRFENILEWYSGKALDIIRKDTLPTLERCEEQGYWLKGVSRGVKAALNKQNVAAKYVNTKAWKPRGSPDLVPTFGSLLEKLEPGKKRTPGDISTGGFYLAHAMQFGLVSHAKHNVELAENLRSIAEKANRETYEAWGVAYRWAKAFEPVADLIDLLDSRRPKPTIVMATLSPTVAVNISKHIGIDITTIQAPKRHGEWVERTIIEKGKSKTVRVWLERIDWPEDTLHNKSKFYHSGDNWQCQACGHAIRNPFNWVPILAYQTVATSKMILAKPIPYSLWVGRDCAEKLFGCEVEGDAIYEGREVK